MENSFPTCNERSDAGTTSILTGQSRVSSTCFHSIGSCNRWPKQTTRPNSCNRWPNGDQVVLYVHILSHDVGCILWEHRHYLTKLTILHSRQCSSSFASLPRRPLCKRWRNSSRKWNGSFRPNPAPTAGSLSTSPTQRSWGRAATSFTPNAGTYTRRPAVLRRRLACAPGAATASGTNRLVDFV